MSDPVRYNTLVYGFQFWHFAWIGWWSRLNLLVSVVIEGVRWLAALVHPAI